MAHNVGRAGPGPQLGWAVPDMGRARNCVLWAGLLGTAQMYTYSGSQDPRMGLGRSLRGPVGGSDGVGLLLCLCRCLCCCRRPPAACACKWRLPPTMNGAAARALNPESDDE
jgi:hypothetical protein